MMDVKQYRKKPLVIEAVQYTGDNKPQIGADFKAWGLNDWHFGHYDMQHKSCELVIKTLEGEMVCEIGDWIIKGIKGEFYPCKTDIFDATYDEVIDA